jgi:hypothetical protein
MQKYDHNIAESPKIFIMHLQASDLHKTMWNTLQICHITNFKSWRFPSGRYSENRTLLKWNHCLGLVWSSKILRGHTLVHLYDFMLRHVMIFIFKKFAEKNLRKKWSFWLKQKRNFAEKVIITLGFEKTANFFSLKISENSDHNIGPRWFTSIYTYV